MSTNVVSQPWGLSSSQQQVPQKGHSRKAPPSPLAITVSGSSSTHLQPPGASSDPHTSTSTSATAWRNSLESSRSDLTSVRSDWTSVRSDLTSLHVSEFPLPPSALPTIPASPKTPISITFSSTTPRSQSPQSGFAYQQQQPPRSPSHNDSQQRAGSPFADQRPGYSSAQKEGPAHYSQYAMYKESNIGTNISRPTTPTTAGTITPRDWPSSGGRLSPLQPPRPLYTGSASPVRSHSPLRNGVFAAQQDELHSPIPSQTNSPKSADAQFPRMGSPRPLRSPSPQPPRGPSPQPPRAPLPAAPRDSMRISHVDMGMDISEEELLSADFISELLNQPPSAPATSARQFPRYPDSPVSARFQQYPDSPRSAGTPLRSNSPVVSDETVGLSGHINANDIHLAPAGALIPISPGFSGPVSVSGSDAGLASPSPYIDDTPGLLIPEFEGLQTDGRGDQSSGSKVQSGLASSIWPGGGDKLDQAFLRAPVSPYSPSGQSLPVPEQRLRSHVSPHPHVPSTPMTPESFIGMSSPTGAFARAQAKHSPTASTSQWQTPSTNSHFIAAHLPIGARPTVGSTQPVTSPSRIVPLKIRQHHYPRYGSKKNTTPEEGNMEQPQSMRYPPQPTSPASIAAVVSQGQEALERGMPEQPKTRPWTKAISNTFSLSSSLRTQRDSSAPSPRILDSVAASPSALTHSSYGGVTSHSRRSLESSFQESTETELGDDLSMNGDLEGEVQVASRVVRPRVLAVAPAVFFHRNSLGPEAAVNTDVPEGHVDSEPREDLQGHAPPETVSRIHPTGSPPASPRNPPSVHSPPSHRTDMPESIRSMGFSEDPHGQELNYIPSDEVAEYPAIQSSWNPHRKSTLSRTASRGAPSRRPSNKATSFKSVVSYMTTWSTASKVSRTSRWSTKSDGSSRWAWLRKKPLPPLPQSGHLEPQNVWQGPQYSESLRRYEADLQLPDLAQRAGDLRSMLEQGSYAPMNKVSLPGSGEPQGWSEGAPEKWYEHQGVAAVPSPGFTTEGPGGKFEILTEGSPRAIKKVPKPVHVRSPTGLSTYGSSPTSSRTYRQPRSPKQQFRFLGRGKRFWIIVAVVILIAIILVSVLAATLGQHKSSAAVVCGSNKAGARCNLDATCTCPSSQSGSGSCSAPLAQAVAQIVPVAAEQFATNLTSDSVALVFWDIQGTPVGNDCSSQATLIDVGSVLDDSVSPNRTQWAQAALLWTFVQSRDLQSTENLQSAVLQMPWGSLSSEDGREADPSGRFDIISFASTLNFVTQTIKPVPVKFQSDASPTSAQLGELNNVTGNILNRMYSFATASSTLQQSALQSYWRSDLSLNQDDLPTFLAAFKSAPILLPFDATASPGGQAISDLLSSATNNTVSFPPPIGCFPGLSPSQVQRVSIVESQVFGLPALTSSPSSFDPGCFANRPVYGILDVMRMRLPFSDTRTGVAKQAAILTSDASTRAVLHVGELLSALPAANNTDLTAFALNPQTFGTLDHLNHTALDWLQSFPNTSVAAQAVQYLLSSPSSPPSSNSSLFGTTFPPTVEVAVFGDISLSDISGFVSNFSTLSSGLFFGSPQGDIFRHWALQQSSSANITWSPSALTNQTVQEGSSSNAQFESIWSQASSLISKAPGGNTGPNDVNQIINAFFGS